VVEFTLPNYGITIVRDHAGRWKQEQLIAFAVSHRRHNGIHVIHTNGSGLRQLTNDPFGFAPSWSPDGQQIAFLTLRAEDHELAAEYDL
ncbi:hypothetical protein HA388_29300, partial [Escherichia coli]|nr:hypothetical protein [Escherichia coli]